MHKQINTGLLRKYSHWHKAQLWEPVSWAEFDKAATAYENHKQYCNLKILLSVMWLILLSIVRKNTW